MVTRPTLAFPTYLRAFAVRGSLTLGLSLLCLRAAHAGPEDAVAAQRAKVEQAVKTRTELAAILANPREGNHLDKLLAHHKTISNASSVSLLSAAGMHLAAEGGKLIVSSAGRAPRAATADDLFRMGISGTAVFHGVIDQAMARTAGTGEASSAASRLAEQTQRAETLLAISRGNLDLRLLSDHHTAVTVAGGSSSPLHLSARGAADALEITASGLHRTQGGKSAPVTYQDLNEHGVGTEAGLEHAIRNRLLSAAKLEGDATNDALVVKARGVLKAELEKSQAEGVELTQIIAEPATNKDIDLALKSQALMAPPKEGTRTVKLAVRGEESIQVGMVTNTQRIDTPVVKMQGYEGRMVPVMRWGKPVVELFTNYITSTKQRLVVVGLQSPQGREATLADLQRFGVGTKAAFDAAASKLVMNIAIEDIL